MSTNTTNYQLIKPDRTDNVLVEDINYNTEIIDQELKKNETNITNIRNNYVAKVDVATETTNGISKIATQIEVDNGIEDTKIVTSKKLKARLDSLSASVTGKLATESIAGIIKISTTAQVSAGTDNTTAVSPFKLKQTFVNDSNLSLNGYQKLPGGLIIQWGEAYFHGTTGETGEVIALPIAFPNAFLRITGTDGGYGANAIGITIIGKSQFRCWGRIVTNGAFSDTSFHWIAIGY